RVSHRLFGILCVPHSRRQLIEQHLSPFQIARVEPFGEPAVDGIEKLASLSPLALIAPEPRETNGSTQFEKSRFLRSRHRKSSLETFLSDFCMICCAMKFTPYAVDF